MPSYPHLQKFIQSSLQEWQKMKPGLERIQAACKKLGHPENKFPSIHVAGTNGKGSVCAMLHSILSESQLKVGMFTSPHLLKVNERFIIGEALISDDDLEKYLERIGEENSLSFFEKCSLIAFLYFADQKVDFAILETGLGGRLDATNIIRPIVSVITEIDLDHMEVLGDSISLIAAEKAGIIKENVPLVCGATHPEARRVIEEVAREKNAPAFLVGADLCVGPKVEGEHIASPLRKSFTYPLNLPGDHQIHNAEIVLKVIEVLQRDEHIGSPLQIHENAIQKGLQNVRWPGRLQWISQQPPILLDGAHNVAAMQALVKYLKSPPPPFDKGGRRGDLLKWKVLFSAASDKKVEEMLKILQEASVEIILCRMKNSRSFDPVEAQKKYAAKLHCPLSSSEDAVLELKKQKALLQSGEGLLITGSLYFIAELMSAESQA